MLKLVGVNNSTYGKYFCIQDVGVDEELEFTSEFELKDILASDILSIDGVNLENNTLIYSDDLNIDTSSNTESVEDEDELEDDYDLDYDDEDYIDESDSEESDEVYDDYDLEEDDDDYTDESDDGIYDDDDIVYDDFFDDEDEEDGIINKLYDMLNPQQVDLLKRYYLWFSEHLQKLKN